MVSAVVIPIFDFDEKSKKYLNFISKQKDIKIVLLNFNPNKTLFEEIQDLKLENNCLETFNKKDNDFSKSRQYILNLSRKQHVYFADSLEILENDNIIEKEYDEDYVLSINKFIQKFIENECFEEYKEILYNDKIHLIFSEYEKLPEERQFDFYKIIRNDFIKIFTRNKYLDFICNLNELNTGKFESIIYSNDFEEFEMKLLNAKFAYQNKKLSNDVDKLKKTLEI